MKRILQRFAINLKHSAKGKRSKPDMGTGIFLLLDTDRRKIALCAPAIAAAMLLAGCQDDAKIASQNLSKAADNFEIIRRVVFFNGITDTYLLSIEGLCSIKDEHRQLEVTCKVGDGEFKKHFLGLSDNVSYLVEQMETADVSTYHHRITFKPQSIIPDIDFRGDAKELTTNRN